MRKEINHVVEANNRDFGKHFKIKEFSAWDAEVLAEDILRAMSKSNYWNISPEIIQLGVAGLSTIGLSAISAANKEDADYINSKVMSAVSIVIPGVDGKAPIERPVEKTDFDEVSTIRDLKDKVLGLNFDFLTIAAESDFQD